MLLASLSIVLLSQVQLCDHAKLEALRRCVPARTTTAWDSLFSQGTYYSDDEIPPAYQHADAGLAVISEGGQRIGRGTGTTFHSPRYNISGDALERQKPHGFGGNGNIEFPWRTPGGVDAAEGRVESFKVWRLPMQADGKPWPVAVWRETAGGSKISQHVVWRWCFPVGTEFGEVLMLRDSTGLLHTFEVRVRRREEATWDIDVLRPFPTREALVARLRREGRDDLADQVSSASVVRATLKDSLHRRSGFDSENGMVTLPAFGERLASKLLDTTPFSSCANSEWVDGAAAPTTNEPFSIVPQLYAGSFLGNDADSCRKCHESTLRHVDEFDDVRQWYGRVRGSDEILSWHPLAPTAISYNGGPINVAMRQAFVEHRMVAVLTERPRGHPKYNPIGGNDR